MDNDVAMFRKKTSGCSFYTGLAGDLERQRLHHRRNEFVPCAVLLALIQAATTG